MGKKDKREEDWSEDQDKVGNKDPTDAEVEIGTDSIGAGENSNASQNEESVILKGPKDS